MTNRCGKGGRLPETIDTSDGCSLIRRFSIEVRQQKTPGENSRREDDSAMIQKPTRTPNRPSA